MGYLHIENLYKCTDLLKFRECYALEKLHGTSAHVRWGDGQVHFHSGGEKRERFVALFDEAALAAAFAEMGHPSVTVYGEAYGGSQQGMSARYGKALKFAAFDVRIGDRWLVVPQAAGIVTGRLGLEFVHYVKVSTDLEALNAERDAPSEQARRNGVEGDQPREGVVLRPLLELTRNDGERVIAKHKRDEERETKTPRVVDPAKQVVLEQASAIADEWVTPTRLEHVLDKLKVDGELPGLERTTDVLEAMIEDVTREAAGEIVDSREARKAISRKTGELFRAKLKSALGADHG
jgi:hypothetical protein